MVSDRRGLGEWIGHSGLADANHYIYRIYNRINKVLSSTGNYIQYPVINQNGKEGFKEDLIGTSLVVQWLRILPPRTRVASLVQGEPTCQGATKPVNHDC